MSNLQALRVESMTPRRLDLILMPTEACNFRCVYCYESFQLRRMAPDVVAGVEALLTKRAPTLRSLGISWFGGEPLLALDVIERVMKHAAGLRAAGFRGTLASDMTTNGFLLTSEAARRLVDLGVTQYQISFDGPREWHDRKRVRLGGRGTFDRIWTNLLDLRRSDRRFRITVRLHADEENKGALPDFLDEFQAAFGADDRFDLFLRALGRFGGPNDATLPVFDPEEGRRVVARLRAEAARRGIRLMTPDPSGHVCYAARANSLLVRADGRLNKCTMSLDHPANQVGRLRPDGRIEVDHERMLPWMRGLRTMDEAALACPMKGLADPNPVPVGQRSSGLPLPLQPSGNPSPITTGGGVR